MHLGQRSEKRGSLPVLARNDQLAQRRLSPSLAHLLQGHHRPAQHAQAACAINHAAILAIAFLSETDFLDSNVQSRPKEVGWPNFPLIWSVSEYSLRSSMPIRPFKAPTELQILGVIAPRTLLPSPDKEGERRKRTYCPTTYSLQNPMTHLEHAMINLPELEFRLFLLTGAQLQ